MTIIKTKSQRLIFNVLVTIRWRTSDDYDEIVFQMNELMQIGYMYMYKIWLMPIN